MSRAGRHGVISGGPPGLVEWQDIKTIVMSQTHKFQISRIQKPQESIGWGQPRRRTQREAEDQKDSPNATGQGQREIADKSLVATTASLCGPVAGQAVPDAMCARRHSTVPLPPRGINDAAHNYRAHNAGRSRIRSRFGDRPLLPPAKSLASRKRVGVRLRLTERV